MEGLDLFNPVPALTEEDSSSSPSPSPSLADSDEDINSDYASDDDYSIEEDTAIGGGQRSRLRSQKRHHQADSPLTISLSPSLSAKSLTGNSSLDDSLQMPKFQVQKVSKFIRVTLYHQGFIYWGVGVGGKVLPQTQYLPPKNFNLKCTYRIITCTCTCMCMAVNVFI